MKFQWTNPPPAGSAMSDEERMIRDAAHEYRQGRLAPRVQQVFRHESTDPAIFREMGELGLPGNVARTVRWSGFELCQLWPDRARSPARRLGLPLDDECPVSLVMVPIFEFGTEAQSRSTCR